MTYAAKSVARAVGPMQIDCIWDGPPAAPTRRALASLAALRASSVGATTSQQRAATMATPPMPLPTPPFRPNAGQ